MGIIIGVIFVVIVIVLLSSIRQINEYERGIMFRFGKYHKIMNPGWNIVLPIIDSYRKVDIRTKAVDVPEQEAITKDNVSIRINAVLYYKIFDASKAVLAVENFNYAVSQLAQTTMRNTVGSVSLDDSYARIKDGEVFLINMYIAKYEEGNRFNHDERRERKLLLHKSEIRKVSKNIEQFSYTLIPLKLYIKRGKAKILLGICKGKKLYDKRETIKKRDLERESKY